MTLERYQVLNHAYAGDWCKTDDVARLEASHAELLEAAKYFVDNWEPPGWRHPVVDRLRAAIAKAEGEGV